MPEQEESLALADHFTYSEQLYGQPTWVLEGALAHAQLDPNGKYTKSQIKEAIDDMLGQKDKRYGEQ